MIVVFSPCSKSKDDSIPIYPASRIVSPSSYINNAFLNKQLLLVREKIFSDPLARLGTGTTHAFNLYVRTGLAYHFILNDTYEKLKRLLQQSDNVQWFFLSGGYGIIHALEEAKSYQASLSYNIAHQHKIPFTGKIWGGLLSEICDSIIERLKPSFLYVFGSKDYISFVKNTKHWKRSDKIKLFESRGSSGQYWLAPILNELSRAILTDDLPGFNSSFPDKYVKQE